MAYSLTVLFIVAGIFFATLVCLEFGRRLGRRQFQKDPEGARSGIGAVEGAIFALLGLLLAFTFSGAAARFDARRQLIVEETNAVGTAYLRLELLSSENKAALQDLFRKYLDSRLDTYRKLPDLQAAEESLAKSNALQNEIWNRAILACRENGSQSAQMLLLPALNQMIDITTTRTMAAMTHPPTIIFVMLIVLVLVSSLMTGTGMAAGKTRSWVHIIGFAAILAVTLYVILDLEYPRLGLIQVKDFDQALVQLRQSMK
jgi:hypothetical protein